MRAIDHQGFVGLGWQDLRGGGGGGGGTRRCHILNIIIWFQRIFFHNTCGYIDPSGVASFYPVGLDWQDL